MATYDITKLVKLAALKALAEKVKEYGDDTYATQAALAALSAQVEEIDIPTNVSAFTNDAKYQNEEEVAAAIKVLEDALKGAGEGSIKAIVDAAINEFSTKVTEGDTIDTFKELVDYVAKHGGEAAKMASAIESLETKMSGIEEGAEKNKIASVSEEFSIDVARNLTIAAIAMSKVTGLTEALAGKASTEHTHGMSDVDGLAAALAGKAATEHDHEIDDVDGLDTALAGKADEEHEHSISDVEGLEEALAGLDALDGIEVASDQEVKDMLDEVFNSED